MSPIALDDIGTFLCAFARAAAFMSTAPYVGDKNLPTRYRVACAALFAFAVMPAKQPVSIDAMMVALPAEIFLGVTTGFIAKLVIAGAEAGGQLIGLQLELGFAGIFDPVAVEETLPTRRIANCLAGLAFLGADGLGAAIRVIAAGRVDTATPHRALMSVVSHGGEVMEMSVRLAAPVIVSAMVAHLTVALANRAAPALNVFSVALSMVLVSGCLALLVSAPVLAREMIAIGRNAAEVVGGLR